MGQIDTSLNSFRNLPDVHPFKLKQNEIGDVVDSFSIDFHIDLPFSTLTSTGNRKPR